MQAKMLAEAGSLEGGIQGIQKPIIMTQSTRQNKITQKKATRENKFNESTLKQQNLGAINENIRRSDGPD